MPINATSLEAYFSAHALPEAARAFIRDAAAGTSRDVGTTTYPSWLTEHQSPKMGGSVSTESATAELAYAIHLDMDPEVLAYFEQPPPIDCKRANKNGRVSSRSYTADFVVLRSTGPVAIQTKTRAKAEQKVRTYPVDWIWQNGKVIDLPAERAFSAIRIAHTVVLNTDLPQVRVENLRTLSRVRQEPVTWTDEVTQRARDILAGATALRLADLAHELGQLDQTPLLRLILDGDAHADLDHELLTEPESCWVSSSKNLLSEVIASQSQAKVAPSLSGIPADEMPSRARADAALRRLDQLQVNPKSRTARRHRAKIRTKSQLTRFLALLDQRQRQGNRNPKRPRIVLDFARTFVTSFFGSPRRPSKKSAHTRYAVIASRKIHPGLQPVTRGTFERIIAQNRVSIARARGGLRQANAAAEPSSIEDRLIRATRPFEAASVDHVLLKIYVEVLNTGKKVYAVRPWLTVLRDMHTGEMLSWWISLKPPKRRAFAMVIRSCLRRHGRLPEAIFVDRGSDFRSGYTSALCAHLGITLAIHPSSHSRYGGEAERIFGIFITKWLGDRPGNVINIRSTRAISGSHRPEKHPCLKLPLLLKEFSAFAAWFGDMWPTTRNEFPAELCRVGLNRFPFSGVKPRYDEEFHLATAVDRGKFKVDFSRGIKIDNQHFVHPALRDFHGKTLEVRIDPEDHTTVYALGGQTWVPCRSSRNIVLVTKDPMLRVAESLLIIEGKNARNDAIRDADEALVELLIEADHRHALSYEEGSQGQIVQPLARHVSPAEANHAWNDAIKSAVDGVAMSRWEASYAIP